MAASDHVTCMHDANFDGHVRPRVPASLTGCDTCQPILRLKGDLLKKIQTNPYSLPGSTHSSFRSPLLLPLLRTHFQVPQHMFSWWGIDVRMEPHGVSDPPMICRAHVQIIVCLLDPRANRLRFAEPTCNQYCTSLLVPREGKVPNIYASVASLLRPIGTVGTGQ